MLGAMLSLTLHRSVRQACWILRADPGYLRPADPATHAPAENGSMWKRGLYNDVEQQGLGGAGTRICKAVYLRSTLESPAALCSTRLGRQP